MRRSRVPDDLAVLAHRLVRGDRAQRHLVPGRDVGGAPSPSRARTGQRRSRRACRTPTTATSSLGVEQEAGDRQAFGRFHRGAPSAMRTPVSSATVGLDVPGQGSGPRVGRGRRAATGVPEATLKLHAELTPRPGSGLGGRTERRWQVPP